MGQKTHPRGFRLGKGPFTWDARWFAEGKEYASRVHEDLRIRRYLKSKMKHAGIAKIEIERAADKIKVALWSARPGLVIGKKGAGIDSLREELQKTIKAELIINIQEVRKPEIDAQLVAENIAGQLERRVAFRRAMKKSVQTALKMGVKGIKIACSGRLAGAEMARYEWYREGQVPLHTLRADIDYGMAEANTTYGKIGVKAWVYKGEIL